ncbi:MerR family transcriptional regulator [Brevibacillus sp. B_LB10_24]|uniref:MerR family transcriptional regulator n=1 Tax=Brevibacillus sp. B_LB10_24 TaxID=3380645 RepID=UPI0038BBE212
MLKIGDFSRLNKISIKTLRHYDEIGLFKPESIDPQTGYRYYSASQLPRLHRILVLKDLGFSLAEIAQMVDNPLTTNLVATTLRHRERELQAEIRELREKLARLQSFIRNIQEGKPDLLKYDVVIKEVEPLRVISIREWTEDYAKQHALWEELLSHIGGKHPKMLTPIALYLDVEAAGGANIEVAVPYAGDMSETERIRFRTLEPVKEAACVIHRGSSETLADAYTALQKWIEENGYRMYGSVREVHLVGYLTTEDTDKHITEIQIPVTRL